MCVISVIIPTYNRAKTIGRAIDSVLQQTYQNIELIVVDDCSTDDTEKVVKQYKDNRLRFIKHIVNEGACAARNTGIEHAQGEFIAFQDSDDVWHLNKLEIQMNAMEKYQADICFCKMERHNYPTSKEKNYPNIPEGIVQYQDLILKSLASTQTIIAKKDICLEHKFDVSIARMQDYDWIIRAAKHHRVCFVNDVLVEIYLQENSITTFDYTKILQINETFIKKYKDLCNEYPNFYMKRLERIGYYKTLSGEDGTQEYLSIYRISKKKKDLFKLLMARTGLLGLYYKAKNFRNIL